MAREHALQGSVLSVTELTSPAALLGFPVSLDVLSIVFCFVYFEDLGTDMDRIENPLVS